MRNAVRVFWLVMFSGCLVQYAQSEMLPGITFTQSEWQQLSTQHPEYPLHDYINRLAFSESLYLKQHGFDPVNWFTWSDDAFKKAAQLNKLIFLSIGYSSCHWCHRMHHESFKDTAVARLLNQHFIAIKVDREQRPDIDGYYLNVLEAEIGQAGWPINILLTPDGQAFYANAYLSKTELSKVLNQYHQQWQQQQKVLLDRALEIASVMANPPQQKSDQSWDSRYYNQAIHQLLSHHDTYHGGFEEYQKFPHESWLLLLLDGVYRFHRPMVKDALVKTLDKMMMGGIHDHIEGGFHRYATDPLWRVPHFEKMLYNQALLSRLYLKLYQFNGDEGYLYVARKIMDFTLRKMRSPEGGFYTAIDAESGSDEGAHVIWTKTQLKAILGDDYAWYESIYGISDAGNFANANVLYWPLPLSRMAKNNKMKPEALLLKIDQLNTQLRQHRSQRQQPAIDKKILTDWNGMMLVALIQVATLAQQTEYYLVAVKTANMLWKNALDEQKQLWHIAHHQKQDDVKAMLSDYAWFADGLIELYDYSGEQQWLDRAILVAQGMLSLWDESQQGFYKSPSAPGPEVKFTSQALMDKGLPSAHGVALRVLVKLSKRTSDRQYSKMANQMMHAVMPAIADDPAVHGTLLRAMMLFKEGPLASISYGAFGAVVARIDENLKYAEIMKISVRIKIKNGWHVNSHQPLQKVLIPTAITLGKQKGWCLEQVDYPAPIFKKVAFYEKPLALFENRLDLTLQVRHCQMTKDLKRLPVNIKIQACSEKQCLPPETMGLQVFVH